jgi:hypothetical protein
MVALHQQSPRGGPLQRPVRRSGRWATPLAVVAAAVAAALAQQASQALGAVVAPRLKAFWEQQVSMTSVRPTLPRLRWAVQPIWWANDNVSDPLTAIDLEPQIPVMDRVTQYYLDMVRVGECWGGFHVLPVGPACSSVAPRHCCA